MAGRREKGKKAYRKGRAAEWLGCLLLNLKGYEILARNYRPPRGTGQNEIDIIARRNRTLCFMEVKYRANPEDKFYAVTSEAKQRIVKAAKTFIAFHPEYASFNVRFDVLLMSRFSIPMHVKDCWGEM